MEGGLSPTPRLTSLFAGFFSIGIVGFGGVLPWARRMIVEQRMWLTPSEFNDLLALCQFLPGPNIVNMAVALGGRFRGVAGSAACLVGLLAAPMAIVILLAVSIPDSAIFPQSDAVSPALPPRHLAWLSPWL